MNKQERMEKDFLAVGMVLFEECECTRMVYGQLQTIQCCVKKGTAITCAKKTDLEFEKMLNRRDK